MTDTPPAGDDERVLVLAPRGRDAAVVAQVLASIGLATVACAAPAALVAQLDAGAGLALLTEESLDAAPGLAALTRWLGAQPPWSDLPVIVLATKQTGRRSARALATLEQLGNVMLLERPLNAETLTSAARSALRSRRRQYQARRHLEEQRRIGLENDRLYQAERHARREAAEAREALSLAVDAAELGTFHCPIPLGEIHWNATCKAHFWLPPDATADFDRFYALLHEDDRERTRAALEQAIEDGQPYDVDYRTVSPEGRWRWIRAKGRVFYDAGGVPTRLDGVTIDISRQKQMQAEREVLLAAERAAREQAEHVSRTKDEFLATLSHELRTPLSAILGWVHVLRQQAVADELRKGIDTIERNARAQARLIEELLDMSRIIAGNVRLERRPLLPAAIVESVVASLQPAAEAKGVRIERAIDAAAGPVAADADRLQQIVWNLLSNAVKFTPAGGRIEVGLARAGDAAVLSITDSGDGIAAEFMPFVFDRFRQGDGSSTRSHGGLGLGLAIVRHLVELHDGTVEARSEGAGQGAVFTVRLPVCDAAVAGPVAAPPAVPAAPPPARAARAPLQGLRILLVDDEPDGREMMTRILESCGAAITPAASAEEAIGALAAAAPHLVISDIGMPRVDGYELLRRVRARGHTLPAIALTAFARSEDRSKALAAGFSVHLAKPVEPEELVSSVARLARRAG